MGRLGEQFLQREQQCKGPVVETSLAGVGDLMVCRGEESRASAGEEGAAWAEPRPGRAFC